jgi:hypothetical protein
MKAGEKAGATAAIPSTTSAEIIFAAYTGILCGVKSYELMQEFCEIRLNWFL